MWRGGRAQPHPRVRRGRPRVGVARPYSSGGVGLNLRPVWQTPGVVQAPGVRNVRAAAQVLLLVVLRTVTENPDLCGCKAMCSRPGTIAMNARVHCVRCARSRSRALYSQTLQPLPQVVSRPSTRCGHRRPHFQLRASGFRCSSSSAVRRRSLDVGARPLRPLLAPPSHFPVASRFAHAPRLSTD